MGCVLSTTSEAQRTSTSTREKKGFFVEPAARPRAAEAARFAAQKNRVCSAQCAGQAVERFRCNRLRAGAGIHVARNDLFLRDDTSESIAQRLAPMRER